MIIAIEVVVECTASDVIVLGEHVETHIWEHDLLAMQFHFAFHIDVKLTVNAFRLAIVDNHYYLLSLYLALVEVKPARDRHVAQLAGEAVDIHHERQ